MRYDIKEALENFKINTFGNKKNIEEIENLIQENEQILFISPTNLTITTVNNKKKQLIPGVCALTDKRFLFKSQILAKTNIEKIPLDKIESINCEGNGLTGSHIQLHSLTKTYDILCSYKTEIMTMIEETFETAILNYKNSVSKYNNSNNINISDSNLNDLKKYKQLLDCNVITEEEFDIKKKELLNLEIPSKIGNDNLKQEKNNFGNRNKKSSTKTIIVVFFCIMFLGALIARISDQNIDYSNTNTKSSNTSINFDDAIIKANEQYKGYSDYIATPSKTYYKIENIYTENEKVFIKIADSNIFSKSENDMTYGNSLGNTFSLLMSDFFPTGTVLIVECGENIVYTGAIL